METCHECKEHQSVMSFGKGLMNGTPGINICNGCMKGKKAFTNEQGNVTEVVLLDKNGKNVGTYQQCVEWR